MIALDTNVLIYADSADDVLGRHAKAYTIIETFTSIGGCIPLQVLGEFLSVCRRKKVLDLNLACARIESYARLFDTPPTQHHDLVRAAEFLGRFDLQYFDALIIAVAHRAGATMLLSEDMHDGLEVDGLRVVNPFMAGNDAAIADYLAKS